MTAARPTRLVRAVLLLGTAAVIAKLFLSGQMRLYMSPAMDPLTALGGGVLAVMGLLELRGALGRSPVVAGHDHAGAGPVDQALTYALVLVPLALGWFVAPRALGSSALGGESLTRIALAFAPAAEPAAAAPQTPPPSQPLADFPDLVDYLRRSGAAGVGQRVRAVGIVARSDALEPNQFVLLRYSIVHCVADARPVALLVAAAADGGWATDQWVQVDGALGAVDRGGERLVSITADRVVPIDEPADPYLPPLL
jgi:putative membrane protein